MQKNWTTFFAGEQQSRRVKWCKTPLGPSCFDRKRGP